MHTLACPYPHAPRVNHQRDSRDIRLVGPACRASLVALAAIVALAAPAAARPVSPPVFASGMDPAPVLPSLTVPSAALVPLADDQQTNARRPVAFEYSDGYKLRAKVHKYASFATLPLFATEVALGQSLYNDSALLRGDSRRGAHAAVGSAIGVLFAANTVTGVWNLWESRHDPSAGKLRWIHGILMLAADAGFLATAHAVPNTHSFSGLLNYETDKATHRNIAFASMGVATISYTIMLFGGK